MEVMVSKKMTDITAEFKNFFYPESMAIIGASESLRSYGSRYIQALLDFGYKGRLYAVNHSGNEVLGFKIYRSVLDIPDSIDLVAVCVPARFTPDVLRDCLRKKIKAAIILSAGFSESGEEGRALEEEIQRIARQGIRVMGPNCFGTYCPGGGVTIVPGGGFPREGGRISLIAQSGQMSEGIIARSFGEGIQYSKVASFGNACNINEADLLEYLMGDEDTRACTAYLEGVRDGRRFFETARANAGKKPVIIWKAGLTRMGAVAASSHTGSLGGETAAWEAFFRQTLAIRVESLEELIDATVGFSCMPKGCGAGVALVSGGGAGAVVGADACEKAGMRMPPLMPETENRLRALLPAAGTSRKNPIDMGNPHPALDLLRSVLEAVAASDGIDVIIIRRIFFSVKVSTFFSGPTAPSLEEQQELLEIPVHIKNKFNKPVVVILPEELTGVRDIDLEKERREIRDFFFTNGIPVYPSEPRAFTALSHLAKLREGIGRETIPIQSRGDERVSGGRSLFTYIMKTTSTPILDEIQSKKVLKAYEIDVTEPVLAKTEEEAVAAAEKQGFPAVMKIISPQITHKSNMGGVKLGLKTKEDVVRAYGEIMTAASEKAPEATIEGVSLQKMADPGLELIFGMTRDPQFGPMLMFGLGGIFVEALKDISFRIVPLSREDAGEMIREIKACRVLEGYRGSPPVDMEYLEGLLLTLSGMLEQNPEIKEMDINPLIAYSRGAIAVDARIILEDDAIKRP